jgi:acetaldehyde dehydrogenase
MIKAGSLGISCSDQSINYFKDKAGAIDLVFDATSAKDHLAHAPILKGLGIRVIDLTPAKVGPMCVPAVNMKQCLGEMNLNMVTCGGQASIPIAYAIGQSQKNVDYVEVVSSIASKSAGPATRINLDEYIGTTEKGIQKFSGATRTKAILNLNPASPCIDMQTTVFAKVSNPDIAALKGVLLPIIEKIRGYVPGYHLIVEPQVENGRIVVMVRVRGLGDYLPEYAGNLDIINCAALAMAEEYAKEGPS